MLNGDLDMLTRDQVMAAVRSVLSDSVDSLVLRCAGVTFMDSTGMTALMMSTREAQRFGATVVLEEPSAKIIKLLAVTGMQDFWPVRPAPDMPEEPERVGDVS